MKAIVLGATGFIGSHVVRQLIEEEIDVRIFRRASSPHLALEGLKFEESIGDLEDRASLLKAFRGCQVVFHTAGYYPVYSFEEARQKEIARRQMKNVIEAAGKAGVRKLIYTSSQGALGRPRGKNKFVNEDSPYDKKYFTGLYYQIKYLLEQELSDAVKKGLCATTVIPMGVFGDYDVKPTTGALVVQIARKMVPAIIDGKTNVVDVCDVARGQVAAMKLGKAGRRYILGGHNTTFGDLTRLIAELAGVPPPKARIPLVLAEAGAFASELVGKFLHQEKPYLSRAGVSFLKFGVHVNSSRAQKELGFKARPIEETFERAIGWFRRNGYI